MLGRFFHAGSSLVKRTDLWSDMPAAPTPYFVVGAGRLGQLRHGCSALNSTI